MKKKRTLKEITHEWDMFAFFNKKKQNTHNETQG